MREPGLIHTSEHSMNRQSKISVALCTYNGGRFVGPQLESVLGQDRRPDEIVICDDGSTDDTITIVRRFADQWPSVIRLIRNQARLGFAKNFEQAMRLATGDVIFLCDQDDFWLKEKIAKMMVPFEAEPQVDLVYCDAALADEALQPTRQTIFSSRPHMRLTERRSAREFAGQGIGFNGCMMAFRSALRDCCLPVSTLWGHDHWIAWIAYATAELRVIPEPLMFYRRHGRNVGCDPDLDGGWRGQWLWLIKKRSLDSYAEYRRQWESMYEVLTRIRRTPSCFRDAARLDEFIEEARARFEFALAREDLRRRRRLVRILGGVDCLIRGSYHRYARGLKSFGKDMMVR